MIKIFAIGLWVCIVALGSSVAGIKVSSQPKEEPAQQETGPAFDYDRTDVISVPILTDDHVSGYVISQLIYTVDNGVKRQWKVPLGFYINDEVFSIFYGAYSNARSVERVKFDDVKKQILDGVNKRFPQPIIKDILVEQFNYLPADQVRDFNKN